MYKDVVCGNKTVQREAIAIEKSFCILVKLALIQIDC